MANIGPHPRLRVRARRVKAQWARSCRPSTTSAVKAPSMVDLMNRRGDVLYTELPDGAAHQGHHVTWDCPQKGFLRMRANSIEGGTTEVMKNILGERVRRPRPATCAPTRSCPGGGCPTPRAPRCRCSEGPTDPRTALGVEGEPDVVHQRGVGHHGRQVGLDAAAVLGRLGLARHPEGTGVAVEQGQEWPCSRCRRRGRR